jgi:hypothetical protein
MTRTLITLAVGLGIIAAGALQTSVRQHTQSAKAKTLLLRSSRMMQRL